MNRDIKALQNEYEKRFKCDSPSSNTPNQIYASDIFSIRDMASNQEEAIMTALEVGYMMGYKRGTSKKPR